jgi:hypothetical protein
LDKTFFAYHLAHFFGPFGLESYHTNSETATEGDLIYVISGHDAIDGGKDYAIEGLFRIHRRQRGPFKLESLSGKPMDFLYRLSLVAIRKPSEPIMMTRQDWYDRGEIHGYFSSGQNFNPIQPRFKERFDLLLAEFADDRDALATDLQELDQRTDISATERETLSRARIGQGKFRADVVALWGRGETCALQELIFPNYLWLPTSSRGATPPIANVSTLAMACCLPRISIKRLIVTCLALRKIPTSSKFLSTLGRRRL